MLGEWCEICHISSFGTTGVIILIFSILINIISELNAEQENFEKSKV